MEAPSLDRKSLVPNDQPLGLPKVPGLRCFWLVELLVATPPLVDERTLFATCCVETGWCEVLFLLEVWRRVGCAELRGALLDDVTRSATGSVTLQEDAGAGSEFVAGDYARKATQKRCDQAVQVLMYP